MISATQMRPGMVIKYNNELYSVFSVAHRTPGNLRGFVQAKMRSLRSGSMTENRFSSEDKVEKAMLDEQEMEYLYDDGEYYYFMNTETYEQMHLMKDLLGDATQYLIPQLKVHVEFYEGNPISVELPATVDMTVMETEPGLKGRMWLRPVPQGHAPALLRHRLEPFSNRTPAGRSPREPPRADRPRAAAVRPPLHPRIAPRSPRWESFVRA